MDNRFVWAIEDIFPNIEAWQEEYEKVQGLIDFAEYKGKLSNAEIFLDCMKKEESISRKIEKLCVYAMMLSDIDTRNSTYDSLSSKAMSLSVKMGAELAFVGPELTGLDNAVLEDFIKNPSLKDYDYMLKRVLAEKPHVLSENEEKLLTESAETFASFKEIFTKIDNADLPLKKVKDGDNIIPLSHGMFGVVMRSANRALRRKCFKSYYKAYHSLLNVISATYAGSVKKDVFISKAKKYNSALERALCGEDVDSKVYYNLISTVQNALPHLHRYMAVKKKELGLNQMHMYDIYVPTVSKAEIELEYPEAYKLVMNGLSCLGEEYVNLLKTAYDKRWIDVYETSGKRSGAYSVAVYDTHPFVLLNYQKTTHDVFTIAHEMGHSIHSYFSNREQCYAKADYKIFVAEVASTVNEVLLLRYLLEKETDKKLKKYLLSYLLEMIRTTLFRQTQFAEFEEFSHGSVEKGVPLTKDSMCEKYLELNKKYYGNAVISDDEIKYEWARIPHFYRAFYVYKYSTGIISALSIADRILVEGKPAVDDYFRFLSSGNSDSPVELLKIAGVDLTKTTPFVSAFKVFENALKEYEQL